MGAFEISHIDEFIDLLLNEVSKNSVQAKIFFCVRSH